MKRRHHHLYKRSLGLLLGALVACGTASVAQAQDISKERRKSKADESTRKAAEERNKQLTSRLDKDKTKEKSDLEQGPATSDLSDEPERSPEEIAELKRQIEKKNKEMIAKLDKIIAGSPYSDQKPEWMFQKAELLWELRNMEYMRARAEYNECLAASDAGNIDASKCEEPVANYGQAQNIYEEILKQYPDYARLDEVIYRLSRGLLEAAKNGEKGKAAKAVKLLTRLVQNYPNSRYKPEAHLAMGEFYFDKNLFGAAKDNYVKVLEYEDYSFREYARYKLAWVHYNEQNYAESVATFKQVVETQDQQLGFRSQALNDLILGFAQLPDGWKKARSYFIEYGKKYKGEESKPEFAYKQMSRMAGYLEQQGQNQDAIQVYEWFIGELPNDKRMPQWMESILIAKKAENPDDPDAVEDTMNRFIAYLDPQGTWAKQNEENEGAVNNASLLTEASLAYLSNVYHVRAQNEGERSDYEKAAGYYERFVERFPNKSASFDMNYLLGEIYLFDLKQLDKAAAQYQKVVDLYRADKIPDGVKEEEANKIVKDSAYAVVNAYNELVKANCDDSILIRMAEVAEKSKDGVYQTNEKMEIAGGEVPPPNPKVDIAVECQYELGFVQASDQWSEMYPKDDATPTVDYVSAEIYKARGHYDKCVPRYESIITNAPEKHRYRSFAGASLLDANYRLERWDEVEKWARYLLKNKIFDVTPKQGLQQTIAYAINERAKDLKEAGDTEVAATELLRLADEFPDSELAPGAVFNAAAIYESGDQIKKAITTYERVVDMSPKGDKAQEKQLERAGEALFVMGAIFESRADFDRAAAYFERLADKKFREHERAADAIYNAGSLRRAMEQWGKAIEIYEKYVELYGDGGGEEVAKNVREIQLLLPYMAKNQENWKDALERFEQARKKVDDLEPMEVIEIHTEVGLLHEKIAGKRWEKEQDEAFEVVYETFGELDEAKQKDTKARYYYSQAKFHQAERIYREFADVKLNFPMSKLTKSLQKKGELEQQAEKIYFEIIDKKTPLWTSAAAYRIGLMYKNFSDELYNLPMPEGLTVEQEDLYRMQLDEYAFPLQEKALAAFQRARTLALQLEAYNEWSRKSSAMISQLESSKYPITEQAGVDTDHDRLLFTSTRPIVEVEVAKARLKTREDERRAKAAEEERKRREAEEAAKKAAAEQASKTQ